MADDGMLLNFSLGDDGIIKPAPKFKGGTWRDRLSAKKRSKFPRPRIDGGQSNPDSNPNQIQVAARKEGERPYKRQRTDGGDYRPATISSGPTRRGEGEGGTAQHPGQVISSLFSFNPEAKTVTDEEGQQQQEGTESKPSNAPLIDGIEDFTALGLSPTLAAHLLTKMELKAPTAIQKSSIPPLLKEDCGDAFIQAETGSGKTLAYLLPLVQRIMALKYTGSSGVDSNQNHPDGVVHRDTGLFAIVLAPTRELCKQISVVLENLLRCAHWIVAGTVIGGEKKKSEKARLRKGLNILVATPGRLADHLDNTQVLDVSNVRWLILDEGDRLMDLGFEEEIHGIVKKLDARQRPTTVIGLPAKRRTVLCSATLKMNVQRLGEISLKDAVHIKVDPADEEEGLDERKDENAFSVPAQLKQSYVVTAAKLRLVTLTALMKRTFARKGSVMKVIIFVSCADSVEFHFGVFTRKELAGAEQKELDDKSEDEDEDKSDDDAEEGKEEEEEEGKEKRKGKGSPKKSPVQSHGTIAPATAFSNPSNPVTIHKLHGSLPQHVRTATLSAFTKCKDAAVLICTDVASRGLDLPNVDFVVEYDPAFSADDHLHRIGRTARLGRDGRALIFLLPGSEENYVDVLKHGYRDGGKSLTRTDTNEVLKRGFGGNTEAASKDWEEKATDWQLDVERWALENPQCLELARRAFQSHIRAYATHIAAERNIFNMKELHLGHLAKAFALRDRPSKINVPGLRQSKEQTKKEFKADRKGAAAKTGTSSENKKRKVSRGGGDDDDDDDIARAAIDSNTAVRKMRAKMKDLTGASEFNLA
jgi:ATP-dependent RNA helicase DDX31/DBP7